MSANTSIRDRLVPRPPETSKIKAQMTFFRDSVASLGESIEALPECRERSVALTKLEEASFWTMAAIARNQQAIDPKPEAPAR